MLGALGATDWIDGYVARRFNQTDVLVAATPPCVGHVRALVLAALPCRR